MRPKLKICGMNHNVAEVAALKPDFLGFIFYGESKRNFTGTIPNLDAAIQKVGVFVNATLEEVLEKVQEYGLDIAQLHGDESPAFCRMLKTRLETSFERSIHIWKVFPIHDNFDFEILTPYETVVDLYLFDTKGKERGGTGKLFNWELLNGYPSTKQFVLSGGIGPEQLTDVKEFMNLGLPVHAIDVNSMFELGPGLKDIKKLNDFMHEL